MSKHTPEPWSWSENLLMSQQKPYEVVLRLHTSFLPRTEDAALVAAAPDLLVACEVALAELRAIYNDDVEKTHSVGVFIASAIAKAKGQNS